MKELTEYRKNLIARLGATAKEFRAACLAVDDPYKPLEENGWNLHQLAVHTRDVDKLVYGFRARRTIEQDHPTFDNFDGEAYMREHYDPDEPLEQLLNGFVESVESLTAYLRTLPTEAWSRESQHATLGSGFTVQAWVERNLAHMQEHLESVQKGN